MRLKSVYSYEFTKLYGATGYLSENNFSDLDTYKSIMVKAEEQKNRRLPHDMKLASRFRVHRQLRLGELSPQSIDIPVIPISEESVNSSPLGTLFAVRWLYYNTLKNSVNNF